MEIDWQFLISDEFRLGILAGLRVTVVISIYSIVGASLIGVTVGLFQVSGFRVLRQFGLAYVTFFRNIPLLVQLFFWYFGLPALFPPPDYPFIYSHGYEGTVAILTIATVMGAFSAEVVRAGIESIPIGQIESALATGLTRRQSFISIVFPQLGPVILPGMSNEMLNVMKSTSLAMTIGLTELTWQAQELEAVTFRGFEAMTAVTVVYLTISLVINQIFRYLEYLGRRK